MESKPLCETSDRRFALLIDADNVSARYIKPILNELSKYGTVTIKRIYGDWTLTLHSKWKDALLENSITPIQQFGYTQGKNATDSAMIIDAMDLLYTDNVDGFCLVSSDSDFTRLASRLRESGRTVIGMGEKKTPVPFRRACDVFTTLELLVQNKRERSGGSGGGNGSAVPKDAVEQAVVDIITDNQNNGKATGLGEIGSRLQKRYPDFDVRSYGTNLLSKLLEEFTRVTITKDHSSVTVELAEGGEEKSDKADKPDKADKASKEERSEKAPRGRSHRGTRRVAAKGAVEAAGAESATTGEGVAPAVETAAKTAKAAESGESGEAATPAAEAAVKTAKTAKTAQAPAAAESEEFQGDATPEPAPAKPRRSRKKAAPSAAPAGAPAADAAPVEAQQAPAAPEPAPVAPKKRARKAPAKKAPAAAAVDTPAGYIQAMVTEAGADGIMLSTITDRLRAQFKDFKVRDLGFSQMRQYMASTGLYDLEKSGRNFRVRLAQEPAAR